MKLHNKIKDFYDFDGRDYGYRRWRKYPAARFDYNSTKLKIVEYLHDEYFYNALEVGCGPGTWTGILNNFAKKITAIDISSTMINNAKEKYKNPNINFLNLDIVDFKNNKKFDLIFSVRALEYLSDKKLFLQRCFDMLNPNGKLIIISKTKKSYWYGRSKVRKVLRNIFPFLFYYEKHEDNSKNLKKPKFQQERIPADKTFKILKNIGFCNFTISSAIIRPPIFMRGKTEIPLVPPFLERPVLKISNFINLLLKSNKFSICLSESYIIKCEKL